MKVQWEDPPHRHGGAGVHAEFFAALREHPGRWARWPVAKGSTSVVSDVKAGKYLGSAKGEFESVSRTVDGERRVYVRYVGSSKSKEKPAESSRAQLSDDDRPSTRPPGAPIPGVAPKAQKLPDGWQKRGAA